MANPNSNMVLEFIKLYDQDGNRCIGNRMYFHSRFSTINDGYIVDVSPEDTELLLTNPIIVQRVGEVLNIPGCLSVWYDKSIGKWSPGYGSVCEFTKASTIIKKIDYIDVVSNFHILFNVIRNFLFYYEVLPFELSDCDIRKSGDTTLNRYNGVYLKLCPLPDEKLMSGVINAVNRFNNEMTPYFVRCSKTEIANWMYFEFGIRKVK